MKMDKNITKLFVYIAFFAVLLIYLRFEAQNKESTTKEPNKEINYTKAINDISSDYYSVDIHTVLKDDAITLSYEKQNDLIIGVKYYHNEVTDFVKYNNEYYILSNNEFQKDNAFNSFNYDKTFIDLNNLKELMNLNHTEKQNGNVIDCTFSLIDVINLYNKINNTNYYTLDDSSFIIKLNLENNKINNIIIDMSPLYNLINTKTDFINYTISVKGIEAQDTSQITNKLN